MSNEFTEMDGRPRPSSETSLQSGDALPSPQPPASLAGLKEKLADDVIAAKDTIKEGADTAVERVKGGFRTNDLRGPPSWRHRDGA